MNRTRQKDLGTPPSAASETVRVEIDGLPATVRAGTSIMRACRESGVEIPKLCATDSLKPFGSCRLCLVEIEGRKGYPASCTTPVEAGMKVRTQTDTLATLRRNVLPSMASPSSWMNRLNRESTTLNFHNRVFGHVGPMCLRVDRH